MTPSTFAIEVFVDRISIIMRTLFIEPDGVRAFAVFAHLNDRRNLAGQEGIEPPTCGFGDRRSAN